MILLQRGWTDAVSVHSPFGYPFDGDRAGPEWQKPEWALSKRRIYGVSDRERSGDCEKGNDERQPLARLERYAIDLYTDPAWREM